MTNWRGVDRDITLPIRSGRDTEYGNIDTERRRGRGRGRHSEDERDDDDDDDDDDDSGGAHEEVEAIDLRVDRVLRHRRPAVARQHRQCLPRASDAQEDDDDDDDVVVATVHREAADDEIIRRQQQHREY